MSPRKRRVLRDDVETFLAYLRDQRDASPCTLRAYEGDLARFVSHVQAGCGSGEARIESVDTIAVRGYVASMNQEGLSRSTVARRLSAGPLHGYADLVVDPAFKQKYRPAAITMGDRHANVFVATSVDPTQWNGQLHLMDWVGE